MTAEKGEYFGEEVSRLDSLGSEVKREMVVADSYSRDWSLVPFIYLLPFL